MSGAMKGLAGLFPPIQRLRDRRDQLERELAEANERVSRLTAERESSTGDLVRDLQAAVAQRDAIVRDLEAVIRDRDQVAKDLTAVVKDRDQAAEVLNTVVRDRDQAAEVLHSVVRDRDQLAAERDKLRDERDALQTQLTRLQGTARLHTKKRVFPPLSAEQVADYQKRIDQFATETGWFHSLDLGHGLKTKGPATADALRDRLEYLHFPFDLTGLSFLDIASWDGYYAFEAEARGAARVLATDKFCWGGPGWGKQGGFLLAREILQSKVEDKVIEADELSPDTVGMFDVVLFSGIFYHLRDPIKSMAAAASVTSKMMMVETHVSFEEVTRPVMGYLPRQPRNETSNYWRPNPLMIRTLLKEMGFNHIEERIHGEAAAANERHGFWNAYR